MANDNSKFTDPVDFIKQKQSNQQWFAYKVAAQENTQSMCCWSQQANSFNLKKNKDFIFQSCDLTRNSSGYGSNNNSPITENINIFVNIKKGKVQKILSVGDACEVKYNGHDALYAISNHKHANASKILFDIASKNNNQLSQNAVFWLGETRDDGVKHLKKLYNELPNGEVKEHINFALAQAKNPDGIELLKTIAIKDDNNKQRADALFWLSQSHVDDIVNILIESVNNDKSTQVQEKAVFSLAQVKTTEATNVLVNLAEKHPKKHIRKQALFWLVEVDPEKARQLAFNILKDSLNNNEIEEAVFTISRIGENNGDIGLFGLLKGNYSQKVKKKALFWLAQSNNRETIDRLASLL